MHEITLNEDYFDFKQLKTEEAIQIYALKKARWKKISEAIRPLVGETLIVMLNPDAPRPDHRIKGIKGTLQPFGFASDAESRFNPTLTFKSVTYISDETFISADHYELRIDNIESFKHLKVELKSSSH